LEPIRAMLVDRRSVLTGPSGVGKSSLLNALFPGANLRVGAISESVNKGRHTTVGALMLPLPDADGYVIDTPGLREIGLWALPAERLDACFPEIRALADECRFADCRHVAEPDCAVRDAVERGQIAAERYDSYQRLLEEIESGA
jgi:ribosome biogenesis GTPase